MARYFQNIDKEDPNFQKITELDFIDNSDPSFLIYYFKDGNKCSKEFIANFNESNFIGKKAYIELTDPRNCWKFTQAKPKSKSRVMENANHEMVEVADLCELEGKTMWNVESTPNTAFGFKPEPDENYFVFKENMNIDDMIANSTKVEDKKPEETEEVFDFNIVNKEDTPFANVNQTKPQVEEATIVPNNFIIDSADIIKNDKTVEFVYKGKKYSMTPTEFFENAISRPEEKIIEKIVEKEVKKEVIINKTNDHLQIDLDDTQKSLIDNMIDMSQKDTCDIDMEITLSLPPVDVYKLIKQVYPEGMSTAFVNIIADRMQILELKSAVANGLLAYYDEKVNITVEDEKNKE